MRRGLNRCKRRETDPFKRMGRKKSVERGAEVRSSFHDNHLRRMYAIYLINFPLREERVSRRYPRWPRIKIDRVFIRVFRKCKLIRDDAPFLFFLFFFLERRSSVYLLLAAGQTSRTVSDREHRTRHTDPMGSDLDSRSRIFHIRSRSNLFNG